MVTTDNYEEYLMMQADGELDSRELAALQAFLDAHPDLAAEAATWQDVKLVPDRTIRYEHPETLLKNDRKSIAFRPWHAAVPVAAALLLALILIPRTEEVRDGGKFAPIAHNTAPANSFTENNEPAHPDTKTEALPPAVPSIPGKIPPPPRRRPTAMNSTVTVATNTRNAETINGLQSMQAAELSVGAAAAEKPVLLAMAGPVTTIQTAPANASDGRLKVQLAAANQEAFDAMKAGLDQRIEQIGRVAKSVRETTVVIKLGGNAFNIHL